ncbi:putative SWI/SNF-related matrix-associated actin-dependent regulator of chromatin subfamily A member 3-like 1 isoform X1 [Arachis hypogaea]|uniref:putative SWI/SNF-related matrix-associated actin-dependent regulator of chromatin subfamily A member 3-like 1 isoform X1 n=1 Tax=Arachis hypogaea TaxID=3818 RepID=UPI000DEC2D3A|nr:putative SWI/SNF-related matrix-associated actin-dependent regulator of chromatin subfamily A member 3-like 1 isoform X1 [Arachis hypogaea]
MEPENVINAYNKHSRRFGFLEAADVEILSPLMDLGDSILLEAVIPARINRSRRLRITCKILISTSLNLSDQITQYIHYCGRRLIGPLDDEFMEPAAKETTALKKFKAVDYSFADLEKKLASAESIVKTRALEPPEGIVRTRLLQHQKEGLWWLLKREECEELPPFWVEKAGGEFFNILTEESRSTKPEPWKGGSWLMKRGLGRLSLCSPLSRLIKVTVQLSLCVQSLWYRLGFHNWRITFFQIHCLV